MAGSLSQEGYKRIGENMIFFDPCKQCLVRPMCKTQCDKKLLYFETERAIHKLWLIIGPINIAIILITWFLDGFESIIYKIWTYYIFPPLFLAYLLYSLVKLYQTKKKSRKMKEDPNWNMYDP